MHVGQRQALDICLGQHTAVVDVYWVQHSNAVHSSRLLHSDSQVEVVRACAWGSQWICALPGYSGNKDYAAAENCLTSTTIVALCS